MNRFFVALFVVLALATFSSASLIGTTVTLNYHDLQQGNTSDTFLVTGGVNITCPGPFNLCVMIPENTVTVGSNTIMFVDNYFLCCNHFANHLPNGFDFQSLNLGVPITSVSLVTDMINLDMSRVSFTANSLQLDMHNVQMPNPGGGYFYTVTLNPSSPTPEPSSLVLFGSSAMGAFTFWRRRRQSH